MSDDKLLTTKQVAEELSRSERWVIQQIQAGKLEAIDLGKGYRVYRSALDKYLEERRTKRDE